MPPETIAETEETLGYALAPTWMPDGFEFKSEITSPAFINMQSRPEAVFAYEHGTFGEERAYLMMSYPYNEPMASSIMEQMGVETPEDAVSEIEINGATAYLTRGGWTDETLRRISRIELPINPEWDYEGGYSIRFTIEVPDNERVWVRLFTLRPTDRIDEKNIVKTARSVVVVE